MKQKGFTFIELMIAISITAVLGTLGIAGFVNYNQAQVLQTSANDVVTMLNLAKSRAQAQIKPPELCSGSSVLEGYEVKIGLGGKYALHLRCSGLTVKVSEQDRSLPSGLSFTPSSASFFFPVQTGGVENSGFVTVSGYGRSRTIVVNSLGGVVIQLSEPTPTPTLIPTFTPSPVPPTPTPTLPPNTYSQSFTEGVTATTQCTAWDSFRFSISSTRIYSKITLSGSLDTAGVSCAGATANTLCQNLRTATSTSASCDGRTWVVNPSCGGGVEINANGGSCSNPSPCYVVRPCIGRFSSNGNWGGVGSIACASPSQTMTVVCE